MRRTLLIVGLGLSLLAGCAGSDGDKGYRVAMLVMPDGDPVAGREALLKYDCHSCHTVSWDEEVPGWHGPARSSERRTRRTSP